MCEYIGKPVPEEAVDTGQSYADELIFSLGLMRFLVNDEGVVTFVYEYDSQEEE